MSPGRKTFNERIKAIWHEIVTVRNGFYPHIGFSHDDEEAFPDGYWSIIEFNNQNPMTEDHVWRGLTIEDALKRAEAELFGRKP